MKTPILSLGFCWMFAVSVAGTPAEQNHMRTYEKHMAKLAFFSLLTGMFIYRNAGYVPWLAIIALSTRSGSRRISNLVANFYPNQQ